MVTIKPVHAQLAALRSCRNCLRDVAVTGMEPLEGHSPSEKTALLKRSLEVIGCYQRSLGALARTGYEVPIAWKSTDLVRRSLTGNKNFANADAADSLLRDVDAAVYLLEATLEEAPQPKGITLAAAQLKYGKEACRSNLQHWRAKGMLKVLDAIGPHGAILLDETQLVAFLESRHPARSAAQESPAVVSSSGLEEWIQGHEGEIKTGCHSIFKKLASSAREEAENTFNLELTSAWQREERPRKNATQYVKMIAMRARARVLEAEAKQQRARGKLLELGEH